MKLMTKELEARFKKIGSQDGVDNPIVVAKYFNPTGGQSWYATEYNPVSKCFFGYASLFGDYNDEWGYFTLAELQEYRGNMGLGIERDLHCGEKPIAQFNISSLLKETITQ
jgi:hypothetical protein